MSSNNKLTPFSLEEWLKNSERMVVTRDGRPVTINSTADIEILNYPVFATIGGKQSTFTKEGKQHLCEENGADLFFADEPEMYVNVYKDHDGELFCGEIQSSVADANGVREEADDPDYKGVYLLVKVEEKG